MIVEMISTGEEVLSGQITDTNASWLSATLQEAGLPMTRRITVGDRREDLIAAFLERSQVADIIIVNGGLGPTVDDLSSETAAAALGEPLVTFPEWVAALEEKFRTSNRPMSPENLKQARLPQSATIVNNPVGTACGFYISLNKALIYFTPGVPSEFKRMISAEILPQLKERFTLRKTSLLHRLHCFGVAESRLDGLLAPIPLPKTISLGFRAHLPTIEIKVMGLGENEKQLRADVKEVAQQIRDIMGIHIICEEDDTITSFIQRIMIERGLTLALAESCTGGMVSSQIVDHPGSSQYFERAFITYTNQSKTEMIGVDEALIQQHGAVSEEVVGAMAEGARKAANTSYGLAISGIAGPDGGSEEKPVGTVCFGLAAPDQTTTNTLRIPNWGRTNIRKLASMVALDMLRRHLLDLPLCARFDSIRPPENKK